MTSTRYALVFAILAFLVSLAIVAGAVHERQATLDRTDTRICVQIEAIKMQIRQTVERQIQGINRVQYYRDHPDEQARAVESARQTLRLFHPSRCP